MKRPKFTLTELLIVIAIIAILASLLLPALNSARQKAKGIQCAGNLKQFSTATVMYSQDFNDFSVCLSSTGGNSIWQIALRPYVGKKISTLSSVNRNWGKLYCPALVLSGTDAGKEGQDISRSYGVISAANFTDTAQTKKFIKVNKIASPSRHFYFLDGVSELLNYMTASVETWNTVRENRTTGGFYNHPAYRHSQKVNGLCYDGHVATFKPAEVYDLPYWTSGGKCWAKWNYDGQ